MSRTLLLSGVATVATLFTLTACDFSLGGIDPKKVEGAIESTLESNDVKVDSVECPKNIKKAQGDTFECTAKTGDVEIPMVVEQVDDQGTVKYEAKFMIFHTDDVADELEKNAAEKGHTYDMDCHGAIWVSEPGKDHTCDVKDETGKEYLATITFTDDKGTHDLDFKPK